MFYPLQVGIEPYTEKRAAIFGRCNPFVAVFGGHGRVAAHETACSQLVSVAIQFENVGCTPCQTKVGG